MNRIGFVALVLTVPVVAAAASLASPPGPAQAAFPGSNGKIAFTNWPSAGISAVQPSGKERQGLRREGWAPAFSADGRRIALVSGRTRAHIYSMNAAGKNRDKLTGGKGSEFSPAWSPGGGRIVFSGLTGRGAELFKMNADGSRRLRLTDNRVADLEPDWSPDGSMIAYVRNSSRGRQEIYTMHADGSHVRARTDSRNRYETDPDWSPNGKKLVFAAGPRHDSDRGSAIYKLRLSGRKLRKLTPHTPDAIEPAWSPNGKRIAFSRNGAIFRMRTVGSNIRKVTASAGDPDWQPR